MSLREQIQELWEDIEGEVHHGECFYDKGMLGGFLGKLDKMKDISVAYYNENQED